MTQCAAISGSGPCAKFSDGDFPDDTVVDGVWQVPAETTMRTQPSNAFSSRVVANVRLRAVATGWRQEQVARNAREIQALGRELHDRLQTVVAHLSRLGDRMGAAVDAYNAAISSFESRVLVSARKFRELGTGGEAELEELGTTDKIVRQLDIPALGPGRRGAA